MVFELYQINLYFNKVQSIKGWSEEKFNAYKELATENDSVVYDFFKTITEENIVSIYKSCSNCYLNEFRYFFYTFKIYKCISKEKIIEIIKEFKWNSFQILEDKKFVEFFDEEITSLLEETNYGIGFVISYYLEETKFNRHVFVPESFSVKKRIKLIVNYINSEKVDTNKLQLIVSAKSTKELPITPLIKQMADKRLDEFLKTNKASFIYKYGFSISFGEFEQEKNFFSEDGKQKLQYDVKWIKKYQDYPTLLNNFIYLFEYVDEQMRFSNIHGNDCTDSIIDLFRVKGKYMYNKGFGFEMLESLSDIQMSGYVDVLKSLGIDIENIIKWFFEDYLNIEFEIENFTCNMPKSSDSILSKCKSIASAIDGVLSREKMLCENGEIDFDLFKYITDSPRIKDVPSLNKNKYCYVKDSDLFTEMNLLFSSNSIFSYTEKNGKTYDTFADLIFKEKIKLNEFDSCKLDLMKCLIHNNTIFLDNDIVISNKERILILREFYKKGVISLQHFLSQELKRMIQNNEVIVENTLFAKSESHYLNYLLNNSEYSDGKAIRNRYIHDSILPDEKTMLEDYITLLKIMILIIIKINDDICIYDNIKHNGDFYEF